MEEYPSNFDAYFNDHFSLRSLYNLWYAYISYALVKPEKPEKLIKAADDFYFDFKTAADLYMGGYMMYDNQLEELQDELARRKSYCEERGCQYYLVLIPSKYHVFKAQVPWSIQQHEAKYNRLDQIAESAEKAQIDFLDLRRVFEKENTEGFYHRLDNHWNQTGGMHAGIAINEMLRKD